MNRKLAVTLEMPKDDLERFKASASPNVSSSLSAGIRAVEKEPELLAKALASALQTAATPQSTRSKTSLTLDPNDLNIVDVIAQKIASSRNAVIQLIIKGILGGVVR